MLERVKYEADQEKNVSTEKRKVAQQYAQDAIKLLKQKLKEEKDHQAEIDYLYRYKIIIMKKVLYDRV